VLDRRALTGARRLHAEADHGAITASLVHGALRVAVPRAAPPAPLSLALDEAPGGEAGAPPPPPPPLRCATLELPLPRGAAAADVALTLLRARCGGEAATLRVAVQTPAAAADRTSMSSDDDEAGLAAACSTVELLPLPRRALLAQVRASLAGGVLRVRVPLADDAAAATPVRVASEDERPPLPCTIAEQSGDDWLTAAASPPAAPHMLLLLEAPAPGLRAADWRGELRGGRTLTLVSRPPRPPPSSPSPPAPPAPPRCCLRHVITLPPEVAAASLRVSCVAGVLRVRAARAPPPRRTPLRVDTRAHAELPHAAADAEPAAAQEQ
jgi:hypothetical protein